MSDLNETDLKSIKAKSAQEAKDFEKYKKRLENILKDFENCRVGKDISKRKKSTLFGVFNF